MVAPPRTAARATIAARTDLLNGEVSGHPPAVVVRSGEPVAGLRAEPVVRKVMERRAGAIGPAATSSPPAVTGRFRATESRRGVQAAGTIGRPATIGHRVRTGASVMIAPPGVMIPPPAVTSGRPAGMTGHRVSTGVSAMIATPAVMSAWPAMKIARPAALIARPGVMTAPPVVTIATPEVVIVRPGVMTALPVVTIAPAKVMIARTGSADRVRGRTVTRSVAGIVVTGDRAPSDLTAIGAALSAAT